MRVMLQFVGESAQPLLRYRTCSFAGFLDGPFYWISIVRPGQSAGDVISIHVHDLFTTRVSTFDEHSKRSNQKFKFRNETAQKIANYFWFDRLPCSTKVK